MTIRNWIQRVWARKRGAVSGGPRDPILDGLWSPLGAVPLEERRVLSLSPVVLQENNQLGQPAALGPAPHDAIKITYDANNNLVIDTVDKVDANLLLQFVLDTSSGVPVPVFQVTDLGGKTIDATDIGGSWGTSQVTIPPTSLLLLSKMIVNSDKGTDHLTLDYGDAGGHSMADYNVEFNGSADIDTLTLQNGTFASVADSFSDATNGVISLGVVTVSVANVKGPITDSLVAGERLFCYNGEAETVSLAADAPGFNRIESNLALPVVFSNPTQQFTIRTGTDTDVIQINSLDSGFRAATTIQGTAVADRVALNTPLSLGTATTAGNLNITSARISLNADIHTDAGAQGGSVVLDGTTAVEEGKTITIDTNVASGPDGSIEFRGALQGTAGGSPEAILLDAGAGTIGVTGTTIEQLTIVDSGGTTFFGAVNGGAWTLQNTTGTVTFDREVNLLSLATAPQGYSVALNGGGNISGGSATVFQNTGSVAIGSQAADVTIFGAGVSTASGPAVTTLAGILRTNGAAISLGPATLTAAARIDSLGTAATGGSITLDDVQGGGNALTIAIGPGNDVILNGTVNVPGAGTLSVNARDVIVQNGSVLAADGTILGDLSVETGGTVQPGGSSIGSLTVQGNTTFNAGAMLEVQVNGTTPGIDCDLLQSNGNTIVTGATLSLSGTIGSVPGQSVAWLRVGASASLVGQFAGIPEGGTVLVNGVGFVVSYRGGDGNDFSMNQTGPWTFNAPAGNNVIRAVRDGSGTADNIQIWLNGAIAESRPYVAVDSLTMNGNAGDDSLTVDYGGTGGFFSQNVTFNGGAASTVAGDSLDVLGGPGFASLRYNATGVGAGNLVFDGATTITFTGLEPVTVTSAAGVTTIQINDGLSHTATITAGPGINRNTVSIDGGLESLTFLNPTVRLELLADAGGDAFVIDSLSSSFAAAVLVDGAAGADSLRVNAALAIDSLVINNTIETTFLNSPGIVTANQQSYGGPVTLLANAALTGSNVALDGTLNGPFGLTVNGAAAINGGSVTTAGANQTYNGPVTLGANTVLAGANVTFGGAVNGPFNLTVNGATAINGGSVTTAGADQIYNGAVALGSNTVLNGNNVTFGGTVNGPFDLMVNGAASLNGGSVVTTGANQVYNGAVGLGANTALTAANVTFANSVTGPFSLAVNGAAALNGGSVMTAGANQNYNGVVTLGANTVLTAVNVTFSDHVNGPFNLTVNSAASLNGGSVNTDGANQIYNGAVTLGTHTVLTGANVAFANTVTGPRNLTIYGNAFLNGSAVTTAGANQTYNGAVTLGANTILTAANVTFFSLVNGPFDLAVNGAAMLNGGLVQTTGANQTYNGPVTLAANTALVGAKVTFADSVNGPFDLAVNGQAALNGGSVITTGASQTYNGAVTLGANTVLTGIIVVFGGTVNGPFNLTVNGLAALNGGSVTTAGANQNYNGVVALGANTILTAANVTFGGTVNGPFDLTVNGTTVINGGSVATAGANQAYNGAVTHGANTVLTAANVTFGGTVSGPFNLTVNGATVINGGNVATVGANQNYNSPVTLGANTILTAANVTFFSLVNGPFDLAVNGAAMLNGGLVQTTGANQTYNGPVTLAANTALVGAKVTFADSVNGPFDLAVNGQAALNGGSVITTGASQTYNGAVTLGANTVLTGIIVVFGGTVNGPFNLTVNGLAALNGGSVTTTGANQTYNGPVTLGADTALTGADLTFNQSVDDGFNLTLTASGNIGFVGAVGGLMPLADLRIVNAVNAAFHAVDAASVVQVAGSGVTDFAGLIRAAGPLGVSVTTNRITASAGALHLQGATVSLNAQIGIGDALQPIGVRSAPINAGTSQGGIYLASMADASTGPVSVSAQVTTGIGEIRIDQTSTGPAQPLTLTNASTFNGAIHASNAGSDLVATAVSAGGSGQNVDLTTTGAGNVRLGSVSAFSDRVTVVSAGAIWDDSPGSIPNITSNEVVLTAMSGIGTFGDSLDTAAAQFDLRNLGDDVPLPGVPNWTIHVVNSNAAPATITRIQSCASPILFDQVGGDLAIQGDVTSGRPDTDPSPLAGGAITITASANFTIKTGSTISSLSKGGLPGGGIEEAGVVEETGVTVVDGAGKVTLLGNSLDTVISSARISSGPMTISAVRDVIINAVVKTTSPGADIRLLADTDNQGEGGVWISDRGQVDAAGSVFARGSDLIAAPLTVESVLVDPDLIDPLNPQILAGGSVDLVHSTAAPADADVLVYGVVRSNVDGVGGGDLTVLARNSVRFSGTLGSNGGNVTIQASRLADGSPASVGEIWMQNNTLIDARGTGAIAGGQVVMGAYGNVTLAGVTTNNATVSAVAITSRNGQIVDGGDLVLNIEAPSGRAVLAAHAGVGATGGGADPALEIDVGSLQVQNDSGAIAVNELNSLTVVGMTTASGPITVVAGGAAAFTGNVTTTGNNPVRISAAAIDQVSGTIDADLGFVSFSSDAIGLAGSTLSKSYILLTAAGAATPIELGAGAAAGFALTDAELNTQSAPVVRIQSSGAGTISAVGGWTAASTFATSLFALQTGGSVIQSAGSIDLASTAPLRQVVVRAGGSVSLTGSANDFNTVAVDSAGSSLAVDMVDGIGNLTLGSVDGVGGVVSETNLAGVSIRATGGDLTVAAGAAVTTNNGSALLTAAGSLHLNGPVQLGNGILTLRAETAVDQTSPVTAEGLQILGSAAFTLTNPANNVGTLAGDLSGSLAYVDADQLAVGIVLGTTGIAVHDSGGIASGDVSISAAGVLAINQNIDNQSATGSIDLTSSVRIDLSHTLSAVGGAIRLHSPTTLIGETTLRTSGAGSLVRAFDTVAGPFDLLLDAAGSTQFDAAVSVGDGVGASLSVLSTGPTLFQSTLDTASGIVQANAAGRITFTDNVTVAPTGGTPSNFAANVTLDGMTFTSSALGLTFGNAATDELTLSGGPVSIVAGSLTVHATVVGPQDLMLEVTGPTQFNAPVTIGDGVGTSLTVNSSGETHFGATVAVASGIAQSNSAGRITFAENVTVAATGDTPSNFAADVTLDGMALISGLGVTFGNSATDQLTLSGGAVSISSASLTVHSTVFGSQDLTLDVAGSSRFYAPVTVGDGVGSALIVNSVGPTRFDGPVSVASGILQSAAAGRITFVDDVTVDALGDTASNFQGDVTLDGMAFTSTGLGVTFGDAATDHLTLSGGPVVITAASLTVNATTASAQDLTLDVAGAADFLAPVALGDGVGAALTVESAGPTRFADVLNAASGIAQADTAGRITFSGDVTIAASGDTPTTLLADVTLDGMTLNSGLAVTFGSTASDQLTLSSGPVSMIASELTVNSTLSGPQDLTLDVAGLSQFNAPVTVGDGMGAALTVDSAGATEFGDTLNVASGIVQSDSAGRITFSADVTVASTGDTPSDFAADVTLDRMTFASPGLGVTFGSAATDELALSGGPVSIVGASLMVNSTVIGPQDLTLNVTGPTAFNAPVAIGDGVGPSLSILSAGATRFEETVDLASGVFQADSAGRITFANDLTIAGTGDTPSEFLGNVTLEGMALTSGLGVTFGNAATDELTLSGGPVSIIAASLTVHSTVSGPQDLTLDVDGLSQFNSPVSIGDGAGASLTVDSLGPTQFNSPFFASSGVVQADTAGRITFVENVTIGAGDTPSDFAADVTLDGMTFTSTGLGVTFGNAATDQLTLSGGPVSIVAASLTVHATVSGPQDLTLDVAGSSRFFAPVAVGDGVGAALSILSPGATQFDDAIVVATGLFQANTAGLVTLSGDVAVAASGDTPSDFQGNLTLDGMTFQSTGLGITFGSDSADAVTLTGGPVAMVAASLTVNSTVDGAQDLTLNVTGPTVFGNALGSIVPIGDGAGESIHLQSPGVTEFQSTIFAAGGLIQEDGAGLVILRGDASLGAGSETAFLANVLFDAMQLNAGGNLTLGNGTPGSDTVAIMGGTVQLSTGQDFSIHAAVAGPENLWLSAVGSFAMVDGASISLTNIALAKSLRIVAGGDAELANIDMGIPANVLYVKSEGSIADAANAAIFAPGEALLDAGGAITIGNAGPKVTTMTNLTVYRGGPVVISLDNRVNLVHVSAGDFSLTTESGDIVIGTTATNVPRTDGLPNAIADYVVNATGTLSLTTPGTLTVNQISSVHPGPTFGREVLAGNGLNFQSGGTMSMFGAVGVAGPARFLVANGDFNVYFDPQIHDAAGWGSEILAGSGPGGETGTIQVQAPKGFITLGLGPEQPSGGYFSAAMESQTGRIVTVIPRLAVWDADPFHPIVPANRVQPIAGVAGLSAPGAINIIEGGLNYTLSILWDDGIETVILHVDSHNNVLSATAENGAHVDVLTPSPQAPMDLALSRTYSLAYLLTLNRKYVVADVTLRNDPNIQLSDSRGPDIGQTTDTTFKAVTREAFTAFERPIEFAAPAQVVLPEVIVPETLYVFPLQKPPTQFENMAQQRSDVGLKRRVLFIVRVDAQGNEGELHLLPDEVLKDLSGFLDRLRQERIPNGLYRIYLREVGFPKRQLIEFYKSGDSIGEPIHEPGRGANPVESSETKPGADKTSAADADSSAEPLAPSRWIRAASAAAMVAAVSRPRESGRRSWSADLDRELESADAPAFGRAARLKRKLRMKSN